MNSNDNIRSNSVGRPKGRGYKKVALGDLLDKFKTDYPIPVPYSWARENDLLPDKHNDDSPSYYAESLFE
jgi:hypothetical protein